MKVLVIAAHPDDEVIGCGGAIAKHVESGDIVDLLILTQIYSPEWNIGETETRKNEALAAAKVLGINEVYFGELPTVKINTVPTITLTKTIGDAVKKCGPNVIYVPPKGDVNADHDLIHKASLVACRPFLQTGLRQVLAYEIFYTTYLNHDAQGFRPNVFIDISDTFAKKISAMKCYKLELREYPHPRSQEGIEISSRERGLFIGTKYAEAFSLVFERH